MRRDDGTDPFPAAGKGARDKRKPGKASGGCPLRHKDHGRDTEVGPGSAPLPFHAPPSGGEERRGARGQSEKSGPIRQGMSVPRLARLRPGPGERDVTTSINRQQKRGGQEGKRGEDNDGPEHEPALQPRHVSPSRSLPSRQRGGKRHGPRGWGPRRTAAGARRPEAYGFRSCGPDGGGRGSQASDRGREAPRDTPVVQSPEDSVSTVISWYKMPTLGKTWTVPGAGGLCLQVTPDSRKRVAAIRDPTGPHRHQRRAGGGGERKGRGYLVDPPKSVKSVPRTGGSKRRGPGRPGPPSPLCTCGQRPGQTCFRIGTLKKFRGAPRTTVSTEGPATASAQARSPKKRRTVSDDRDHACARNDPPKPSGVLHAPPAPAPTYGAPRLG